MKKNTHSQPVCFICHHSSPTAQMLSGELVCKELVNDIKKTTPDWNAKQMICHDCLSLVRSRHVHSLLLTEKGELSSLEHSVLHSLNEQELLSTNMEDGSNQQWTRGEHLADKIASFGGSWWFLISFGIFLMLWILSNSLVYWFRPADPYPYIFLNLILSCLAAVQAPVIMMSQNRQEAKDRIRSQHDYQINWLL